MTGVEILATQEVATAWTFNWYMLFIVFAITIAISLIGGLIAVFVEQDGSHFLQIVATGIVLGLGFGAIAGEGTGTPIEYETQYKVIISDEVSMNEFVAKYEIISQEGRIYTVQSREEVHD